MKSVLNIYDDVFSDDILDKISYLYSFFKQCNSNWQYDFIQKKQLKEESSDLHTQYVKDIISELNHSVSFYGFALGYEAWINNMPHDSKGLEYHYDCDEGHDEIINPLRTFVIYLGPSSDMKGGSLVLDIKGKYKDRSYNSVYSILEDLDDGWIQVPHKHGRVVSFDPTIPHAVLPIKKIEKNEVRMTLTIAVWDKEPTIVRGEPTYAK